MSVFQIVGSLFCVGLIITRLHYYSVIMSVPDPFPEGSGRVSRHSSDRDIPGQNDESGV